ncbi:MAG: methyltransferase [Rhizobiales bacterium]|nr:methyltransferase [Hyphomicrobiales bacterium]NRB13463.1 methyltransferase [Hyphomicrobiales bacterium]
MDDYTDDDFLDGKLILRQPKKGYRAGSDALLLAAALPLCQGKMLEVGAGVGAPSLCYLARVGVELATKITALEKFKNVAKLAQYNVDKNHFEAYIEIVNADIFEPAKQFEKRGLTSDSFDHIYSNPPFFDPKKNKTSADDYKALAHSIKHDDLARWLIFMVRLLKNKALMSIIYPMEHLYEVLKILENRVGDISIRPIFSKPNAPATRFLLQAKKGSRAPLKMLRQLNLRHDNGSVTEFAEGIFRHGKNIMM